MALVGPGCYVQMICRLVAMPSTFSPKKSQVQKQELTGAFLGKSWEIKGNGWLTPFHSNNDPFGEYISIYIPIYSHYFPSFPHWWWIVRMDPSFPSPFRKHQKKPGLQGYCISAGSWTQKYLHEISWNPHTHIHYIYIYIYIYVYMYTW